MDMSSPEPTIIVRTLKDFDQFVSCGNKHRESTLGLSASSRLRLNFSDAGSDCSSYFEDSRSGIQNSSMKRQLDSLTGLDVSKRFREKDTEIVEANSTITMLKGRLQNVETSHKKARVESESELENLKRKQMRDKELIDDLQHKIKRLQGMNQEAVEDARKVKQQCNNATYEAESKMISMQQQHMEQDNRLHEEVEFLQQKVLELEADMEEKIIEAENTQCQADELMEQLNVAQCKLSESSTNQLQVETLQLKLEQAKAKIKNLEMHRDELADLEKKNQVFEATMAKLHIMERENTKLKEENKFHKDTALNTKLMEEKLNNAKNQIMALESRCEAIAHDQAKADLYKNNLKRFEDLVMEELDFSQKPTIEELKNRIIKLKKEDKGLTDGIAELCASQVNLKSGQMKKETEIKNLRAKLEKQQTASQQNTQIIKRLQRKILLLSQERDSLKNVLTTYEAELTINFSTVSQERIEKLESQLESYREELKLMEEELEDAYRCGVEGTEPPKKRERSERTLSLEKRVKELEEEVTKLSEANEVLEGRIENLTLKGDYDPIKTKVLHFENNPLAEAIENRETEMETLQTENEALRERVRLLEEGEQDDLTQKVGMKITEGSSKDLQSLQEQVTSLEKQSKRMLEVFKKKSQNMREAIYLLTGYRVDGTSDNNYKLTNIYAESPEDFFMFELAANGQLKLLETVFSSTVQEFIEIYLHRKNSYPSFLSAVTLDLFDRQSMDPSSPDSPFPSSPPSPISGEEEEEEEEMDEGELEEDEEDMEDGEVRPRMSMVHNVQRKDVPDDDDEEEEEEDEELDEEEEEEEEENEEGEEDDGDDLICLD